LKLLRQFQRKLKNMVELDDFMAAKPITKTRNEEESRKKKKKLNNDEDEEKTEEIIEFDSWVKDFFSSGIFIKVRIFSTYTKSILVFKNSGYYIHL
jgi:hypothetical protein